MVSKEWSNFWKWRKFELITDFGLFFLIGLPLIFYLLYTKFEKTINNPLFLVLMIPSIIIGIFLLIYEIKSFKLSEIKAKKSHTKWFWILVLIIWIIALIYYGINFITKIIENNNPLAFYSSLIGLIFLVVISIIFITRTIRVLIRK